MRRLLALAACLASAACSLSYHREYHPETRNSYVQNISYGVVSEERRCDLGRAKECWQDCFAQSRGEACYMLGLMFETGHGVPQRHESAEKLIALAARLGYQPASIDLTMAAPYLDLWRHDSASRTSAPSDAAVAGAGDVRSADGVVVVYGNLNGNVYVGR